MTIKLHDYYHSSAAYRVRIALHYKGLSYEAEQHSKAYEKACPQELVPSLIEEHTTLTQSLAILEYIDESHPEPPLLPERPRTRAIVRSLAQLVACDIHPLNNLRVLQYLKDEMHVTDEQQKQWYQHWITEGFTALEQRLEKGEVSGRCCFGDTPTLADLCLIPQVYNANHFQVPMDNYPLINSINTHCLTLEAFQKAQPKST